MDICGKAGIQAEIRNCRLGNKDGNILRKCCIHSSPENDGRILNGLSTTFLTKAQKFLEMYRSCCLCKTEAVEQEELRSLDRKNRETNCISASGAVLNLGYESKSSPHSHWGIRNTTKRHQKESKRTRN